MTLGGPRALLILALGAWTSGVGAEEYGRAPYLDRREPPSARVLDTATRQRFELGQAIYNTTWVPAGTPRAERRDGLGPLFNTPSCDACHNNGARGRAPLRDGETPNSFVMQFAGDTDGRYGSVLNTSAIPGFEREGDVIVSYRNVSGRYADGTVWTLREPRYQLVALAHGPLHRGAILGPRIGPALFGIGLLENVPPEQIEHIRRSQPRSLRGSTAGRFGWQAEVRSLREQTERALQSEMGLTTAARPRDDCATPACRAADDGLTPEVSAEFLEAILTFQRELAVPAQHRLPVSGDESLFEIAGCAVCHRPELETLTAAGPKRIRPFTDLLVHDMGPALADRRVDGRPVSSRWRTAPLWGLQHAIDRGDLALMHDGRARSIEEAILWHGGQGAEARRRFSAMSAQDRLRLIAWVASQ